MDKEKERRAFYCGFLAGCTRAFRKMKGMAEYKWEIDRGEIEEDLEKYLNESTDEKINEHKKIPWSVISKMVGWDDRSVEYPTMEEIDRFCEIALRGELSVMIELFRYFRFLKVARSDHQREIIGKIINAVFEFRNRYCE